MARQTLAHTATSLVTVITAVGDYVYLQKDMTSYAVATPMAIATSTTTSVTGAAPMAVAVSMDFSDIVGRYGPTVVDISTTVHARHTSMQNLLPGMSPSDPFSEFFKRSMPQMPQRHGDQIMRGLDLGLIVSSDELISTSAYVVDGTQEVNVKLTNHREFKTKVLGVDKQSDVAALHIPTKNLPVMQIGSPTNTKVGKPMLAIGSSHNFENTVMAGAVSARPHLLPDSTCMPFIQIGVTVNPGNSGDPLFNQHGGVVGIGSQVYNQTSGYQGLSFAMPVDVVVKVEQQLASTGEVAHSRLGVAMQKVDQPFVGSLKPPRPGGALANLTRDDGPAAKAGLQPSDVILQTGDAHIDRSGDLSEQVADIKPDSTVSLQIIHQGKPTTLTVTIGVTRGTKVASNEKTAPDQSHLGLAIWPLQSEEKRQNGLPGSPVVMDMTGSLAKIDVQPGNVILSLDGAPMSLMQELRMLVGHAGKHVVLPV